MSPPHRRRHARLTSLALLLSWEVSLCGCNGSPAESRPSRAEAATTADTASFTLTPTEIVIGQSAYQTVLVGFFYHRSLAEVAVIDVDEDGRQRLTLHPLASDVSSRSQPTTRLLPPGTQFVDKATIDGKERLLIYAPPRLSWLDLSSSQEHLVATLTSNFRPPRDTEVPHVDISEDVNGDGRDDLVIPDADGFWILTQDDNGNFGSAVKLGAPPDLSPIYGADGYRYHPWEHGRIFSMDHNQDGRNDLIYWSHDHFKIHHQAANGTFSSRADAVLRTEIHFDSDDPYALAGGDQQGTVLQAIDDLNGDHLADLIVHSLQGRRLSKKKSVYQVHFGELTPEGFATFARQAGARFHTEKKIHLKMDRMDVDGDGRIELMLTNIDVRYLRGSLWKTLKGLMGDDVRLDLEFYRMQNERYPDRPDISRKMALDGPPSHREPGAIALSKALRGATHVERRTESRWPRAFNALLRLGDLTGDGIADLVISSHPRHLQVFVGANGPPFFSAHPRDIEVAVPNDEETIWLTDIDRDGRQDIILHRRFIARDGHGTPLKALGTEHQRVILLRSR